MNKRSNVLDMTQGNIMLLLIRFTIPLLCGYLLQQMYNVVDSWVVGNYVGDTALTAVGFGFPVTIMFTSLFSGICGGFTVVIAQSFGAGRMDKVKESIQSAYSTLLYAAIPLTLVCIGVTWPILKLMNASDDVFPLAFIYLVILGAGVVGSVGYNLNSSILQGLGNTRPTLLFIFIAAIINIVLDLIFVINFHWDVVGVAVATILAQYGSFFFGYFYIRKHYPEETVPLFKNLWDKDIFKEVFRLGLPQGIQNCIASIVTMLLVSEINRYGDDFCAGYNVGSKIENFAFYFILAISIAGTTFTGQNIGAKNMERVKKGAWITAAIGILWPAVTYLFIGPLRFQIADCFTDSAAIIEATGLYIQWVYPCYIFFAIMFCFNAVLRGAGESMVPLIIALVGNLIFRVAATILLSRTVGSDYMYLGYSLGYGLAGLLSCGYYLSGRWKKRLAKQNFIK